MAALDASSLGFSGTPDVAISAVTARPQGVRRGSIWGRVGRVLCAASNASAMTYPEVAAMIMLDGLERDRDES